MGGGVGLCLQVQIDAARGVGPRQHVGTRAVWFAYTQCNCNMLHPHHVPVYGMVFCPPQVEEKLKAPERLEERVSGILMRIEQELDAAEKQIGSNLHVLDLDNDGLISKEELDQALRFLKSNLDKEDLDALLQRWGCRG